MKLENFREEDFEKFYDDAIKRGREHRGAPVTMGTIVKLARDGGYSVPLANPSVKFIDFEATQPFNLDSAIPVFYPAGMEARYFAGPRVGRAVLFPLNALSLFVALGGGGKTSAIVKFGAHIAAGKPWGADELTRRKTLIFSVEEGKDELDRKFGASVYSWTDAERQYATKNLRMVSLVGKDPRLTRILGTRSIEGTELTHQIIAAAKQFSAEVIFLDHLQGFTSGDLNNSDTATALALEANRIISETGAAVILAAHTNKGNIGVQEVLNGFTTGSLAFENAARQVVGIIPLPDNDAKKLGLEAMRGELILLAMPKNSYGPGGETAYLQKAYVPEFHTVKVEPFHPSGRIGILNASDRLKQALTDFIQKTPGRCSKNAIEKLAGKKGLFKASKGEIRETLCQLVQEGILRLRPITQEERSIHRYPYQSKEVFEYV